MKAILIIALSFFMQSAWAKNTSCSQYEKFTDVSMSEMKTIVKEKKATIIDVNSADSFKEGHIPGALHYAAVESKFSTVLPPDKNAPIVAYCGGKMCTAWQKAAKAACEMGYTNIRHFSAGIKGWNTSKTM